MKTYYLTGASGFLGTNILLDLLKEKDIKIVCFVHNQDLHINTNYPNLTLIKGDVLNKDDINKFLLTNRSEENILIHSASKICISKKGDKIIEQINVDGTKNLLISSLKYKIYKFIYISSVDAIYKEKRNEKVKEPLILPNKMKAIYPKTKAIATSLVREYRTKLNTNIVYPSALLGPNDYLINPINKAISLYLDNKLNTIVTGGYDLVDVRDISSFIIKLSKMKENNEEYILNGYRLQIKELIDLASKIIDKPSYKHIINASFVKLFCPLISLISKIKKQDPLFTSFLWNVY